MKTNLTAAEKWWNDLMEYERTHESAFASPGALREARLIAELDRVKRNRRSRRHKVAARCST
ncbi:MAG: hypothetical protein L0Z50_01160 [Verrucomicrobiales bacterium]|nr:hypothetical protein [Verrucomicrobiales bacterium]